jgi:hypothetical protein
VFLFIFSGNSYVSLISGPADLRMVNRQGDVDHHRTDIDDSLAHRANPNPAGSENSSGFLELAAKVLRKSN